MLALPGSRDATTGIAGNDIEIVETAAADDPAALKALAPGGCDLAVIDSYRLDAAYIEALRGWAGRRLVLSDRPAATLSAEIVLDPVPGRRPEDYQALTGDGTLLLTGPDHALLRSAFARVRHKALTRRTEGPVRRLLVALGGGDAHNTRATVLDGIARSHLAIEVHLAGRAPAPLPERIGEARLVAHGPVAAMHDLIADCDLAIGAAGGSAWERAALGLPTLMIELADNQADNIAGLVRAGAAQSLGRAGDLDAAQVAAALKQLASDGATRVGMAKNAARLCDALGAGRVALAIAPRHARDGKPLKLRRATLDDSRLMFAWQQLPAVRRFSRNPHAPSWQEHSAWLAQRLARPQAGTFAIIEHGDEAVGVLRLDPTPELCGRALEPDALVVSILVDPSRQRQGIAETALASAFDLVPGVAFYAEVLAGNTASHSLFRRAGYTQIAAELYRIR
jgi:spore coat polysaccharide biosynthesis predicted glycosyltransferase SpsG/RimJ/RimL family protein N-acetyltransferase